MSRLSLAGQAIRLHAGMRKAKCGFPEKAVAIAVKAGKNTKNGSVFAKISEKYIA
ncbi:hypothetical protein [Rhizobium mulingense]|uniref:hypothetical protein n=1 Tax=Rhizobium mulingense TaxID=3031128 RepID=UPI002B46119E|nr:hypothetical protein [Rhizobium sp. MJ21]MEB3042705.1 hypothetical protein [Rhizobium sp. MJ21]